MKKLINLSIATIATLALFSCGDTKKDHAEDHVATDTLKTVPVEETVSDNTPPMDSAAMQKAWESFMTPGEMHQWMTAQNGKWKVYKGKMMGMDFEGRSLMAYDNAKKIFVTTWVDNMGTGVVYMEGPYDESTKTITLKGKMTDPTTGKDTEMRQVYKMIDDKTQVMEMYCKQNGKEYKNMEIKLAKK